MQGALRTPALVILTVFALVAGHAQRQPDRRLRKGFAAVRESELRAGVAYLTGDALQGRMSLQPGDDAAAQWVAARFAEAGLQPAARDAAGKPNYLQPVPLVEYTPDASATRLTVARNGSSIEWGARDVSSSFRQDVDVHGALVFAGYGISAPELHYDDYAGVDVRGKVVLLLEHEPQETDARSIFNGLGNTRYATARVKLLNAQRHGAVAVLMMPEPNATHVTTAARLANVYAGVTFNRMQPIPLQGIADDEVRIPLATLTLAAGSALLDGLPAAQKLQAAIDADLQPQTHLVDGAEVHLHTHNRQVRTGVTANVAGLLPGSDPALSRETVIVSAHHDHNGASEVEEKDGSRRREIWRGADDNASGTAGVVALAHAFQANGVRPRRSILFVVFAAEERGPLSGSYFMAQHPLRPLATTRAMLNFDMIGRDEKPSAQTDGILQVPADTSNRLNVVGSLYSPTFLNVIEQENQQVGLTLDDRFEHEVALGIFFRSDQFPFILHDVPAIWFFTGFHPDYHHVTDTAEKLNYGKMTKIVQLGYLTLFHLADAASPPKFIANPVAGQ